MRPPILAGIVIALVLVAASILVPRFTTGPQRSASAAQQLAAQARAELEAVSPQHTRLTAHVDVAALRGDSAALEAAVQAAGEALQQITQAAGRDIRRAEESARQAGLRAPSLSAPAPTVAGLQSALAALEQSIKDNTAQLAKAQSTASSAVSTDGDAIGVQFSAGMVHYAKAAEAAARASSLRTDLAERASELLATAARWTSTRGSLDQYRGLDTAPVAERLRADLAELAKLKTEAEGRLSGLQKAVQDREAELAQVTADLMAAREQLVAHEALDFEPGNDSSFAAYRARFLELSERIRSLQDREFTLRFGGRVGARLDLDAATSAPLEGGEPTEPLEVLRERLETATELARRLGSGSSEMEEQIRHAGRLADMAKAESQRYAERLAELLERQKSLIAEIADLSTRALTEESAAIAAAGAAANAFKASHAAIQSWKRAASELQNQYDPQRQNDRLTILLRDPYLDQVGPSAEAAARVLAGRVYAGQVESGLRLADVGRRLAQMSIDESVAIDPAPFDELVSTAQTAGMQALDIARANYERLGQAQTPTVWAPLGALAAAELLAARLDPAQADILRAKALETIQRAVDKREQSPYLWRFVLLRDHLLREVGAAPGTAPGETPPAEEDDFFRG